MAQGSDVSHREEPAVIILSERRRTGLFLAPDLCDRCGVRARPRVVLRTGELLFCGHHGGKHYAALEPIAVRIECDRLPNSMV